MQTNHFLLCLASTHTVTHTYHSELDFQNGSHMAEWGIHLNYIHPIRHPKGCWTPCSTALRRITHSLISAFCRIRAWKVVEFGNVMMIRNARNAYLKEWVSLRPGQCLFACQLQQNKNNPACDGSQGLIYSTLKYCSFKGPTFHARKKKTRRDSRGEVNWKNLAARHINFYTAEKKSHVGVVCCLCELSQYYWFCDW